MDYPTRENMQKSADYYADYGDHKPRYVAWMLAMYDALDAKQAQIDGLKEALEQVFKLLPTNTDFRGLDTEIFKEHWNAYDTIQSKSNERLGVDLWA